MVEVTLLSVKCKQFPLKSQVSKSNLAFGVGSKMLPTPNCNVNQAVGAILGRFYLD